MNHPETATKFHIFQLDHQPLPTAPQEPRPIFLRDFLNLPPETQHLLVYFLLPVELLVQFDIDPITLRNREGKIMVHVAHSEDGMTWALRLLNDVDPRDPLMEIEMQDTAFDRIAVVWLSVNDPRAPRFDIDRLPNGEETYRGAVKRNIEAEIAAMLAGLAPGQVRRGLGIFRRLMADIEQFFAGLHQYEYEVEPLYYHNAVLFERHGFHYIKGREFMRRIHEGFLPGGDLARKLDGSTPFRDPALARTIRGRSWAIHDGILDEPWDGVKLMKRIGQRKNDETAAHTPW